MSKYTIVWAATGFFYAEVEAESLEAARDVAWDEVPKNIDDAFGIINEIADKSDFDMYDVWKE